MNAVYWYDEPKVFEVYLMKSFSEIRAMRAKQRAEALDAAWKAIQDDLADFGVHLQRFGSSARGKTMAHSDLDIMVLGDLDIPQKNRIDQAAARAARRFSVPYDLHFASDYTPNDLQAILS